MERLSPAVSLYRPEETGLLNGSPSSPKLIIVASWTDVRDEHIAKYVINYQALFHNAQILLVKSAPELFFNPRHKVNAIHPANLGH
jgi:hypothetical protein